MNTKSSVRLTALAILLIVSLAASVGMTPAKAGPAPTSANEAEGPTPRAVTAILGQPAQVNRQPKLTPLPSLDLSREPGPDSPVASPDPAKDAGATPKSTRDRGWVTMMTETFEGVFPSGLWNVYDGNGANYGEYYWDDDDFKPHNNYWSAWAANGGANGLDPQYNNYPNYLDSWMVYGPFDLSGCALADYDFYYWNNSESGYDEFQWYASQDGTNFYGWAISGDSGGWDWVTMDLNGYAGDNSVWLAFKFVSDYTVTNIGAFVDDIQLWCYNNVAYKDWTFMVYLDGDNNLESAAINDFLEMSSVGSNANVNIVALMDRISGYDTSYDDWTDARRFYITNGLTPAAANGVSWGEVNMGDPAVLLKFVRWAKAYAPAYHYALVFWDHGAGWRLRDPNEVLTKGVSFDDTSGGDSIDMPELKNALNTLTSGGAYPFDIVGMDACLMAMAEVDNQIKPYATIRVGSEETEPNDGWPYDTILSSLVGNPSMSANTLATNIVDFYYSSYGNNNTQSAVNLGSQYTTLNTAVNNFATALMNNGHNYISEIQWARNNSQQFAYTYYIDLWDFADTIRLNVPEPTINAAAISVKNAVTAAMIHEHSGASWPWATGISIYFPKTAGEYDARYDGGTGFLQFTASTQWDEWIHKYHQFANYPAMFNKSSLANGVTGQPLSVNFGWASSAGTTTYDICMFDKTNDNICNSGGAWYDLGNSLSVAVGGLTENTTYFWQVRARNASGTVYANKGVWWSFATGSLPAAFNKSSPASGATNQPLNPTISWGASAGATSYEYCYDTTNDNGCSGWTNNGASTSKAISGLSQNTTYYWHVRALNGIGTRYSNGSSTAYWSFTTGGIPGAFGKANPANGAVNRPTSVTLTWAASANASSYWYCYDTNDNDACDTSWINNGSSASSPISGLASSTEYFWQVKALNSFGETQSNGGLWWTFATANAAPHFTSAPILTATVGAPYLYDISADDPDDDPLTFTAPTLPDWLELTDNGDGTATLSGSPTSADLGNNAVTLHVADDVNPSVSQSFTIVVAPAPPVTITFKSVGAQDGWILESGENTNVGGAINANAATFRLGDDVAKKQYRSILSFGTGSEIPDNAVITKVTLKVKRQGIVGGGNPVTMFQGFMVDMRKGTFGTSALQVADWQANANKTFGPFTSTLTGGWYTFNLTSAKVYINKLATGSGLTQIRLRFKLDDNNNAIANFLSLYSGDAPTASRPQLIIKYYVP